MLLIDRLAKVFIAVLLLTSFPVIVEAQTTATPQDAAAAQDLRTKVSGVRQQVLDSNPKLQTEEKDLLAQMKEAEQPGNHGTPDDAFALHERWVNHEKAVREKAIAIDPSVASYF